ncbi:MAG: hypothetical protein AB7P23_11675, partial [Amphiplicatus sp.]
MLLNFDDLLGDPLVIDLDGDGLALVGAAESGVLFDIDDDSFAENVGWFDADDGLLFRDLNSNDAVDGIAELFGDSSTDAFTDLASFDLNADDVIDAQDAVFADLQIWKDADSDGVTDAGEIFTLAALGITSISLATTAVNQPVNGNVIHSTSKVTFSNGETRDAYAVFFDVEQSVSDYIPPTEFTFEDRALLLPNIAGSGDVADLVYAMSLNSTLLDLVDDLVKDSPTLSVDQLMARVEEVVLEWTGADEATPGSFGPNIDARRVAVLEAFNGTIFGISGPNGHQVAQLNLGYERLLQDIAVRFAVQAPSSALILAVVDEETLPTNHVANGIAWAFYDPQSDSFYGDTADILGVLLEEQGDEPLYFTLVEKGEYVRWFLESAYAGDKDHLVADMTAAFTALEETVAADVIDRLAYIVLADIADALVGTESADTLTLTGASPVELGFLSGLGGADALTGDISRDYLLGGLGDDTLAGAQGNDIYLYNLGDGEDVIVEGYLGGTSDRLELGADITVVGTTLTRSGSNPDDAVLSFSGGGSVTLGGAFSINWQSGVEEIVFDDETVWTQADLREMILDALSTTGNDEIDGFYTDDVITGGLGDDILAGAGGNDTYIYADGDGDDVIGEGYLGGTADRLELGAGITPAGTTVTRPSGALDNAVLSFSGGGSVTLYGEFSINWQSGVEEIVFDDETVWTRSALQSMLAASGSTSGDDVIDGFTTADIIIGGLGNDTLRGAGGNDIYIYNSGDGNDTIVEGYLGGTDRLQFGAGIAPEDVTIVRSTSDADDATLFIDGGGSVFLDEEFGYDTGWGVEFFEFAGGVVWTRADLQVKILDGLSTSGNDVIDGFSWADIITGGLGDDALRGSGGDDDYIYNLGDGHDSILEGYLGGWTDRLILGEGILPSEVKVSHPVSECEDIVLTFS